MITVPLPHGATLQLPDCWENLTQKQTLATVRILARLFAGGLTPARARLEMLVRYTGYRPSRKFADPATRETVNYNLLKLSEMLGFAFTVEAQTVRPHFNFKRNPLPELEIDSAKYRGKIFDLDITARTDITAREFVDAFDLLTAFHRTGDGAIRARCLNQLCAILYPATPDHRSNLVSGQHERMRAVPQDTKTLILYRFTGIVQHYVTHPVYSVLFSNIRKTKAKKYTSAPARPSSTSRAKATATPTA